MWITARMISIFSHKSLIINMIMIALVLCTSHALSSTPFDFDGDSLQFSLKMPIRIEIPLSYDKESIIAVREKLNKAGANEIAQNIKEISEKRELCDWFTYQLIRQAANSMIPKSTDYLGYTTAKWYMMNQLGLNAVLALSKNGVLLYIRSDDQIYNVPTKQINDKQYVCLNYHDYNYATEKIIEQTLISEPNESSKSFSFNISRLPESNPKHYMEKELIFEYANQEEKIKIRVDSSLRNYLTNYPVTEYQNQFNIPLSIETKHTLISSLKEKTEGLSLKKGVEYLMYFTRNAFGFEKDSEYFGREKRLSPEETLLYNKSDCEDRAALFYALVKEIYHLPMIVIEYQDHITVAVKFDKPFGKIISFQNQLYTICEPTPQSVDLRIGQISPKYKREQYQIAFSYQPRSFDLIK